MKNILLINAHPTPNSKTSISNQLMVEARDALQKNDNINIININIYEEDIPRIDETLINAWGKNEHTKEESQIIKLQKALVKSFKEADGYIISTPTHNFNVPSKLKDYFDMVLIAGETFRYTENGPVGLLSEKKQVLLLQASGSIYTKTKRYMDLDYLPKYVKSVFSFMGIDNFNLVRAQGLALPFLKPENILLDAKKDLSNALEVIIRNI